MNAYDEGLLMKAVIYESFLSPPILQTVPDPTPEPHGVVIRVKATGVCRSDWHGWSGTIPIFLCLMCRDTNSQAQLKPLATR